MNRDTVEFYLQHETHPFCHVDSALQPREGDLVNIRKVTYEVIGASFSVDDTGVVKSLRYNVIVRRKVGGA